MSRKTKMAVLRAMQHHQWLKGPEHMTIHLHDISFWSFRQEKIILMKGYDRLMTDRLIDFLLFLLAWNDQPAEQTQAAWAATHPIGGADA